MFGDKDITINVDKAELLTRLKENRETHATSYYAAKEGFKIELKKELEKKLSQLDKGAKVDLRFENQKPESHLGDYDNIIGMLEFASDTTIPLNQKQYKQYVENDWDWTGNWSFNNDHYIMSASQAR